jgi:hypothetical protein
MAAAEMQITVNPSFSSKIRTAQIMAEEKTALLICLPMMLEKKKV